MSFEKLKKSSAKTVASVDVKDTQQSGLSDKIMRDLSNPKSKVAQNVNKAIMEAWGVQLAVENDQLIFTAAQGQGR